MINTSTVLNQVLQWLMDDPNLQDFTMTRGEPANEDPGKAKNGWLGLYRRSVDYEPRNLGVPPNNYDADLTFDILVQKTHLGSGAEAEDVLEECVKYILDRVVQVPKTYIDSVIDISVQYAYVETDKKTMYFQAALITVVAEISEEVE